MVVSNAIFMTEEEVRLRRSLLFRLLRGFDFDAPIRRYEPLAAAVEGWQVGVDVTVAPVHPAASSAA